ncbi:MAG: putative protein YesU [Verrucomicrobiae bacterium]|nr:putative protein YesU [Verrucomicrobiae bacterium]
MPIVYANKQLLYADEFTTLARWLHEGGGQIERAPDGGMRLHCFGSEQGGRGCMAFFTPTLPDHVAIEYEIVVRSHGGLVINYVAIRGLNGEDLIEDRDKLPPRTGVMADYFSPTKGLQSYHVSFSRFDDRGVHTDTSNIRRNPGGLLVSEGIDPCMEINRPYRIRVCKSAGHFQFYVDGVYAHGFFDRDTAQYPVPDRGKFGFRLIGSDVLVDVRDFSVFAIEPQPNIWKPWP